MAKKIKVRAPMIVDSDGNYVVYGWSPNLSVKNTKEDVDKECVDILEEVYHGCIEEMHLAPFSVKELYYIEMEVELPEDYKKPENIKCIKSKIAIDKEA
jgi:hypothetical protein